MRIVASMVALAFAGCAGLDGAPREVPAAIAVPASAKRAFTWKAAGTQNYECRARADGGHEWAFTGPEAVLRDPRDAVVGRHYGGPTWEHADGSKVTGKVLASSPAPATGDIPWLLLQGTSAASPGTLSGVAYVQRVDTRGGVAPAEACTAPAVGQKRAVPYTADYVYWKS